MLLTRAFALTVLLASLASAQSEISGAAPVESPDVDVSDQGPGRGSVTVQLGLYDHADNGDGNPFLDEDLTVIEPIVVFDYNATDRLSWGGTFSFDYVSSASIDRLSKFPDQSGASGDTYFGLDMNVSYKTSDRWRIGGHLGGSTEYDYNSIGLGVNAQQDLENADASLTYSLDAYFDSVDIIRFDGTQDEGTDNRTSLSATVGWYQILSPTAHGQVGLTVAKQNGFLETPYNAVVIENPLDPPNPNLANNARGTEITEELEEDRLRIALYGRVRKSLGVGTAYELGGRLYSDDWGINSVTFEPRYYKTLGDDVDMRLHYRFYTQTEADAFADSFTTIEEFRTQDSDLGDYDAHTLGTKFTWRRTERSSLDLSLDYTIRSDGLDYLFAALGWTWSF